ncbi:MAG: ABC transporter permease [Anaerolineaceae bacterium]|nr:ABC transporter permease [Anaerolineaceae bacterium]
METENKTRNHLLRGILTDIWRAIAVPLGAVLLAMVIGAVLLLISGANPLVAYGALFKGSFGNISAISRTMEKTTPLIFGGLAVSLAFKAGMFNIGAQGQLLFGAITSAYLGFALTGLPWYIHAPVALIAGALAGALFGAVPGLLKAYTGAHEVITTIMLNYIAMNLTDWLVGGPIQDRSTEIFLPRTPKILDSASMSMGRLVDLGIIQGLMALYFIGIVVYGVLEYRKWRKAGNEKGFAAAFSRKLLVLLIPLLLLLLHIAGLLELGFIIAVGAAWFVWWLLEKTTIGFEIRTVGINAHAAKYAGMRVAFIIVLTMMLSGLLAGMGGAVETLAVVDRFEPGFNVGLGADGITIALLAKTHPLGTIPAALLVGAMKAGQNVMQFEASVPKEIIDVIQGMMLFFVAAELIVRRILRIKGAEGKISLTSGWGKR